jgi:hypothetical protein
VADAPKTVVAEVADAEVAQISVLSGVAEVAEAPGAEVAESGDDDAWLQGDRAVPYNIVKELVNLKAIHQFAGSVGEWGEQWGKRAAPLLKLYSSMEPAIQIHIDSHGERDVGAVVGIIEKIAEYVAIIPQAFNIGVFKAIPWTAHVTLLETLNNRALMPTHQLRLEFCSRAVDLLQVSFTLAMDTSISAASMDAYTTHHSVYLSWGQFVEGLRPTNSDSSLRELAGDVSNASREYQSHVVGIWQAHMKDFLARINESLIPDHIIASAKMLTDIPSLYMH